MLPANLLRTRISRGKILPQYSELDQDTISLARNVITAFETNNGKPRKQLDEKISVFEAEELDYKLVRGLSTLLEKRSVFKTDSSIDPRAARMTLFKEASRTKVITVEEREKLIHGVANKMGVSTESLEKAIYSDIQDELILKSFKSLSPKSLLHDYNVALIQTLLSKSLRLEFTVQANQKNIFQYLKLLGLLYTVEQNDTGYQISIDGPLSISRMTDKYGSFFSNLLPHIMKSDAWEIKAEVRARTKNKTYSFEVDSNQVKDHLDETNNDVAQMGPYDTILKSRFARNFNSCGSGWNLTIDPEPLVADGHVLVPDFGFEKYGTNIFLEIVGFWTEEYLKNKINKLDSLADVDMFLAVDQDLACSKTRNLKLPAIYYVKDIPLKLILDLLTQREEKIIERDSNRVRALGIQLNGDVVSIEDIAQEYKISVQAIARATSELNFDGYSRVGEYYIAKALLITLRERIDGLKDGILSDALALIDSFGLQNPYQIFDSLNYTVLWDGLDTNKGRLKKI